MVGDPTPSLHFEDYSVFGMECVGVERLLDFAISAVQDWNLDFPGCGLRGFYLKSQKLQSFTNLRKDLVAGLPYVAKTCNIFRPLLEDGNDAPEKFRTGRVFREILPVDGVGAHKQRLYFAYLYHLVDKQLEHMPYD